MKYLILFSILLSTMCVQAQDSATYYGHQLDPVALEQGLALLKQTGAPITGRIIEHYPNGQLRMEGFYIDGKKDGTFKWWYESGQLGLLESFVAHQKDGVSQLWHGNGQLKQEAKYKNNKRRGSVQYWDEQGNKKSYHRNQ